MPKLTPKRTFLLRHVEGKDTIARKGMKIDVTDEEHKRLGNYFVEGFPKKKQLSVK
jgi:hypothetical protein